MKQITGDNAIKRRKFLLSGSALGFVPASRGQQKPYPTQAISVIVPFAPGGNLDVTTRIVTTAMGKILNTPMVVDNRSGAGGLIGHDAGIRAQPDGYTLIATANGSYAVAPRMAGKRPFTSQDFAPVGFMASTPLVLVVPSSSTFTTVADFLAFARANPSKIAIGHSGNGTTNHVAVLKIQEALGTSFTIVPYKGSAPGLTDVLGGQVQAFVDQLPSALPYIKDKRLRPLAVTSRVRTPELPDVPSLAASGLPGLDVVTASGLLAPGRTPPGLIVLLNDALNKALALAEVKTRLAVVGATVQPSTPQAFGEFLAREDAGAAVLLQKGLLKTE